MKEKKGKKKKANRRSRVKYPALDPEYNIKIRHELIDYDYLDKLSDEELKWLNDFTREEVNAAVGRQKDEGKDNRFNKSKEDVKRCQDNNNSRNACIYGRAKAMHKLVNMDKNHIKEMTSNWQETYDPEELYATLIDLKNLHGSGDDTED